MMRLRCPPARLIGSVWHHSSRVNRLLDWLDNRSGWVFVAILYTAKVTLSYKSKQSSTRS
jgi:hypothetical protein